MIESLAEFPVVLTQQLLWGDMDAFQHINNTVYFRFFEDARIAYFQKTRIGEHVKSTGLGPILASTRCDFRAPLVYPGTVHVGARIIAMEKKRFTMGYCVYSQDLDKIAAEGEGIIVYYDYGRSRSCEIPEQILENIKSLEQSME